MIGKGANIGAKSYNMDVVKITCHVCFFHASVLLIILELKLYPT